jgi:flagellar motor switch protein FliN
MSDTDSQVPLPDLNASEAQPTGDLTYSDDENAARIAADLEAVFDVPVQVSAVLGRSRMEVGELLKLGPGMCSNSIAGWARPSISTSTIAW